ncbi:shikimate kinase [Actinoplanes regularis]|uniref:Shikimate kinase n=1 Tax=Actinoplanes regularis TaxID=52697 RepID=A0A239ECA0_9ACTN|nr:shikimate kinase [Actinoplanes regularis]GIE89201.1 shikimate kinase [Actinoplanes regularis]GLW34340.1 shikimate kinase [Actinoplanes regularis]SNS42390.1 shikimate kinase [Actinoplanes regularis]
MRPVAVLVGPPGAGKTTIGEAVAAALGTAFADTDSIIETRAGKPIPEIFIDDGEPAFRALERTVVAESLETFDGVLALGGGAILDEGTRKLLVEHTVVFLSVELADAIKRVGLGAGRPLLAMNPRATMKFLLEQRRPLYTEVAAHTVSTDDREPEEIAAEIAALLRGPA